MCNILHIYIYIYIYAICDINNFRDNGVYIKKKHTFILDPRLSGEKCNLGERTFGQVETIN